MWQIGWMISLIPDSIFVWITYALMFIGLGLYVVSKLVSWFPFISRYRLPAEIAGVVILVGGSYLFGSHGTEMLWRNRVADLEAKIAVAEEQAKKANESLSAEIKKKAKVIYENKVIYRDRIKEVEKVIDAQCTVTSDAIEILNASAQNRKIGEKK